MMLETSPLCACFYTEGLTYQPDTERILQRLHVKPDSRKAEVCLRMLGEIPSIVQPKGVWRECVVEHVDEHGMVINGITFCGELFWGRIEEGQTLYPYIVTCGREVLPWYDRYRANMLHQFWAECMMEDAMNCAYDAVRASIGEKIKNKNVCDWNPGSLPEWPLEEQRKLFAILGEGSKNIAVELTDQLLMLPEKSLSGIYLESGESFHNCKLCSKANCINRRTANCFGDLPKQ